MKKTLLKTLAVALFSLFMAAFVHGQTVPVKDNKRQKIRRIVIEYQLQGSSNWLPALGNFYVPSDAESLRFIVDLEDNTLSRITARLELRQVCAVLLNGDIEVSRQLLLFASNARLVGKNENTYNDGGRKKARLQIRVEPPEGSLTTDHYPHCQRDPDHLGEGPYQAFIFASDADRPLLDGNDTLDLNYTQEFETVNLTRFERLKLELNLAPEKRGSRRSGRRRG